MSDTIRADAERDGFQTRKGLNKCPPAKFRRVKTTKPNRAAGREAERIARITSETPGVGFYCMPYFT